MRKSIRIVAPLCAALFAAPVVQSETLSSVTKGLRGNSDEGRTLQFDGDDLFGDDDIFFDDLVVFDDDTFTGGGFGGMEFLFQDENWAQCLGTELPALTEAENAAYEEANIAFLDAAPTEPQFLLELTFSQESRDALKASCDQIGGALLDQSAPLVCTFPNEESDANANVNAAVSTVVNGFAQCFPNTEACVNAEINAFIAFTFELAGADCDFDFGPTGPIPPPLEEGPPIPDDPVPEDIVEEVEEEEEDEEEPEEEELEEEEESTEEIEEEEESVLPVDPNPPPEVVTTVVTAIIPEQPAVERPYQNLVLGPPGATTAGFRPQAINYIQANIRRPAYTRGGFTLPPRNL